MTSKELAEIASVTEQAIRKKTKKAADAGAQSIVVEGKTYLFEQVIDAAHRGKAYRYTAKSDVEIHTKSEDVTLRIGRNFLMASEEAKAQALLKCRLVEEYIHRGEDASISHFLGSLTHIYDDLSVNPQKLYRWQALYLQARDEEINPAEYLLDRRGKDSNTKLTQEMQDMAIRMITSRKRTRTTMAIYEDMHHHFGDTLPSYATISRFCNGWKLKNPLTYEFAINPDSAKNKYMMSAGSYSEGVKGRNQIWELDSTPADVITSDGKRLTVLGAIDVFSRRVVFHLDERSSAYSIARLLRKAIRTLGIPDVVVTDNGKDYVSNHFASVCQTLGIYQKIVPPFSGDAKPHIERVFRSLSGGLFEGLEGYIGHNVAERSALTAQKSFADKQASISQWHKAAKTAFQEKWKFKKENLGLELKVTMSADELEKWIEQWNSKIYEQRRHSSLDATPMQKWNSDTFPIKSIPDPRMLDILVGEHESRKVGKEGIRVDNAHYVSERLIPYAGQTVLIMKPENYGYIMVFDTEYRPICIAEDPDKLNQSRAKFANIKAKSKAWMRSLNKLMKEWEQFDAYDPNIKTRIEEAIATIQPQSLAVMKHTPTIDAVLEAAKAFADHDAEAAKESHTYNIEGEKLLPSGRPQFLNFYDRLLFDLENEMFDEKSKKIAEKYPESYALAYAEYQRRKAS